MYMYKQIMLLLTQTCHKLHIVYSGDMKCIRLEKCENQHNFYFRYINDTFEIEI